MTQPSMPLLNQESVRAYALQSRHVFPPRHGRNRGSSLQVRSGFDYPLYRYTKESWYNSSRLSGNWSLGTIRGYRDTLSFGEERGDGQEGYRSFGHEEVPEFQMNLAYRVFAQNAWTLCLAQKRDNRFYEWPNNDCCFEIFDERFFVAIAQAVNDRSPISFVSPCAYVTPADLVQYAIDHGEEGAETSVYMGLVKPNTERYNWQSEVRFIAEPLGWDDAYNKKGSWGRTIEEEMNRASMFPDLQRISVFAPEAASYTRLVERKPA